MSKFFMLLFCAFMLFGCDGRECQTKENKDAIRSIFKEINHSEKFKHMGGNWSCGFLDRYKYVANEYGATDEYIKFVLKNVEKMSDMPNIDIQINIYKNINFSDKNLSPGGYPALTIKLDTRNY